MHLSAPGGCTLVPYSADLVLIESTDPLQFAVVDQTTNDRRLASKRDSQTFSFVCKEYPIEITLTVTEVTAEGCRLQIHASEMAGTTGD